jgi:PAS domain-containing protein
MEIKGATRAFTIVCKNGEKRAVEIHTTVLNNGDAVSMYFDVSKRIAMEEAHRESEERYRMIFENTVEGIYITHREGVSLM